MKTNKKGISLIVLIITIVVIIILAAAIILNLSKTNVVTNANKAVNANDLSELQSLVNLKYGDIFAAKQDTPTVREILYGYPLTIKDGNTTRATKLSERVVSGVNTDLKQLYNNNTVGSTQTEIKIGTTEESRTVGANGNTYLFDKNLGTFVDDNNVTRTGKHASGEYYLLEDFVVHFGAFSGTVTAQTAPAVTAE